jgi:sugar porter (SP) family MFS transporter
VACLNITALLASIASAYVCDKLGRRASVRGGAFIYFVAAIIQIFMPNLATLFVGRCIQGIGVGMLSMTVPILQCEIAPGHGRGLFVSIEYFFLNSGYALSAWVGYGFFFKMPSEIAWRGPYIVQAGLAAILFIWTFYLPETPRWLIQHGYREEGLQVLADLHGSGDISDPLIVRQFVDMETTILLENKLGQVTWGELFQFYPRRVMVGVSCQQFAQTNGINALLYFLPENLARAGFTLDRSLLYAGACALIYCAGTIPTMFFIDSWGRRPFLLYGSIGLAASLAAMGGLQFHSDKIPDGPARLPTADGYFAAVCVYLFIFGATWGPGPWLLSAEIFPVRARAKGMALATSTNWLFNFILAFITPPLFAVIGGGFYFILLASCLCGGFMVWKFYPETSGRTLEELGDVFGDGKVDVPIDEKVDGHRVVGREEVREPGPLVDAASGLVASSEATLPVDGVASGQLKVKSLAESETSGKLSKGD